MVKVSLGTYGNYSSDNYGAHAMEVNIGNLTLYFSYKTVVAFTDGYGYIVSENNWGPTTGKHLNAIDHGNKSNRLKRADFEAALEEVLKKHDLTV